MLTRSLRRFALVVVLAELAIVSRTSFGQPANFAAHDSEKRSALEQTILKVNEEMLDAEMRADIPAFEQFLPDSFVRMTQGGIQNKSDFLNALKNGRNRFMAYELKDVQLRVYGTTAVLAGGFHLKSTNGDTDNLFADVWIQQKGKWQTPAWVTNRP